MPAPIAILTHQTYTNLTPDPTSLSHPKRPIHPSIHRAQAWKRDYNPEDGGGGGGSGFSLGPIGDLFRSLFYMTMMAGFGLGVGCALSPEVRAGVKQAVKDLKR